MNKIYQYNPSGYLERTFDLTYENIERCNGMMSRIYLKNGEIFEKYLNAFDDNGVVIDLWLINEKNDVLKDKINFDEIVKVESILYSHPRWGNTPYKRFEFHGKPKKLEDVEIPEFLLKESEK